MTEYEIGKIVISKAGHDKGNVYVIIKEENEYVYLADGAIRTKAHLKKKNKKHIQITHYTGKKLLGEENLIFEDDIIKQIVRRFRNCVIK